MEKKILIIAKFPEENEAVFEIIGIINELKERFIIDAYIIGKKTKEDYAFELIQRGVSKVFISNIECSYYSLPLYLTCIKNFLKGKDFTSIFFLATDLGKELAPRVAASLKLGITADSIALNYHKDKNKITGIKPSFSDEIMAEIISRTTPDIFTIRPGLGKIPSKDLSRKGEVITLNQNCIEVKNTSFSIEKREKTEEEIEDLEKAKIIIGVGRGIKDKESLLVIREIKNLLKASIGGTRPAVYEGYIEEKMQIGLSGKIIKPRVYIAFGISGALQHMAGIKGEPFIVAVNKDPDAPIFKYANIGIIGDSKRVAVSLLNTLKESFE